MGAIVGMFAFKLITLAGSIATTLAVVSFFAFSETLAPWFWQLLVSGFIAIGVGEGGALLLARHLTHRPDDDQRART